MSWKNPGTIRALPYFGGKSCANRSNSAVGQWIASLLPQTRECCYLEPYAGMLGVLLSRQAAKQEIVNDYNDRLIRWWRTVRDAPAQLERLVRYTPQSRAEFAWAASHLDGCPDACQCHLAQQYPDGLTDIYKALALHIVLRDGITKTDGKANLSRTFNPNTPALSSPIDFDVLADRMRHVQIECGDAIALLERVAAYDYIVAYVDPPYPDSDTTPYRYGALDKEELAAVLRKQAGKIALSGNAGEYDDLLPGWRVEYHNALRMSAAGNGTTAFKKRTEAVYCNYQQEARLF